MTDVLDVIDESLMTILKKAARPLFSQLWAIARQPAEPNEMKREPEELLIICALRCIISARKCGEEEFEIAMEFYQLAESVVLKLEDFCKLFGNTILQ